MQAFATLPLRSALQKATLELGYTEMTPVQAASLPAVLDHRDVLAQASTGSGKTAAFALGILSALQVEHAQVQGLVLCPTRELAEQVSREIRSLARFIPNVKVLTLCGGVPVRVHLTSLTHQPHVAVGTPGRILDLLRRNALPLTGLQVLVLDEADRMLDMGFADDIGAILECAPKARQTLLFSATMPAPIRGFSRQFQRNPLDITITDPQQTAIEQAFFGVEADRKIDALVDLLSTHRPESVIVFCNTRDAVRRVAHDLREHGFSVLALHGELQQSEREEMLVRFVNRSSTVLVATDVAARGLDIKELPLVVNFDVATDPDVHIHRIGRTGRAGSRGLALTLAESRELSRVNAIGTRTTEKIQWGKLPPSSKKAYHAPFITLGIDAGRQNKLRPGDVLGALTGDAGIPADAVGKIDVLPTRSFVAITRAFSDQAIQRLRAGKMKGRSVRVRKLGR